MPYSTGPYALFTTLPVPPRPTINSARSINFTTMRYEVDQVTGGFVRMPPTAQRVVLLISFEVEDSLFITPQGQAQVEKQITAALGELTNQPSPLIEIKEIAVGSDRAGQTFRRVTFRDLTKNTDIDQTVQLT